MRKLLNIFLCIAIVFSNFSPLLSIRAYAEGSFSFWISYPDADVLVEENLSYEEAYNKVKDYDSTEISVGVIKNSDNRIVYAEYAVAETDYDFFTRVTGNSSIKYLCSNPSQASTCNTSSSSFVASYESTWGADSAFIDYDVNNNAVKLKVSGAIGYLPLRDVNIVPISKYYFTYNIYNYSNVYTRISFKENFTVRSEASNDSELLTSVASNNKYIYYPSKTVKNDEGNWYYIKIDDDKKGYVCSEETKLETYNEMKSDTFYYVNSNVLHFHVHKGINYAEAKFIVGTAPFSYDETGKHYTLKNSSGVALGAENRYYSFDGNYFYEKYSTMIEDYRKGTYLNSVNYANPYYPYFVYLPVHSISNYTKESFDNFVTNGTGINAFPTNPSSYVNFQTGKFSVVPPSNVSMMYGIGKIIISAQEKYGVNALTIFGAAKSESALGRSAIAFAKNNLFGYGASDSNPFGNAKIYNSVEESVNDYAFTVGVTGYGDAFDYRYMGTHLGNKQNGQAFYYASDPYSGYSKAQTPYNNDKNFGNLDEFSSTLGITKNTTNTVKIYKEPSLSSDVIYETKNYNTNRVLTNMPFVVREKITKIEDGKESVYYKVFTDVPLDKNRNLASRINYSFDISYGYIRESDLYVQNNAPKITANNIEIDQYTVFDPLTLVSASDLEDDADSKKLKITYFGDFDYDKAGIYNLTFEATDSSNLTSKTTATIKVNPTYAPEIEFEPLNIPQYKEFNELDGVVVTDKEDTDILDRLVVSGTVDTSIMGEYILTYTATDNDGNVTTKTRTVNVIANEKPVITAINKTAYLGERFDYLDGVSATDLEDGDVSSSIVYEGIVDTSNVGTYSIIYKAYDLENQETVKIVTIIVEEKRFELKDGRFYLHNLSYDKENKLIDFTGYLVIKGINNSFSDEIKYDIIFENQYNGETIVKSLSRLTDNVPFDIPSENGLDYKGSWFKEKISLSSLPSGDYTVYIRSRCGDYESKELLKNEYFNSNVVRKFTDESKGYQFRINYYNRELPLELFVRDGGLLSNVDTPTIDNMYNQVYSIDITNDGILNLKASSHNVNGDYSEKADITRILSLVNVATIETVLSKNVGSITNGPYKVNLKVSDGKDKTRVWYETAIDLTSLPRGTYSIILRTKTKDIDDYGELYDVMFMNLAKTVEVGDKKISILRNDGKRFRIEIVVE